MQVQNRTVITGIPVRMEQLGKISAPFLVNSICRKILAELIIKQLMGFPVFICGLFGAHDGSETEQRIHIFVNSRSAVPNPFTLQVYLHAAVSVHTVVFMINIRDF